MPFSSLIEWRVMEDPPDDDREVLIAWRDGDVTAAWYRNVCWMTESSYINNPDQQPVAWAELPKLPRCQSGSDGECWFDGCPQIRDGEPAATGRHCPLDFPRVGDFVEGCG